MKRIIKTTPAINYPSLSYATILFGSQI